MDDDWDSIDNVGQSYSSKTPKDFSGEASSGFSQPKYESTRKEQFGGDNGTEQSRGTVGGGGGGGFRGGRSRDDGEGDGNRGYKSGRGGYQGGGRGGGGYRNGGDNANNKDDENSGGGYRPRGGGRGGGRGGRGGNNGGGGFRDNNNEDGEDIGTDYVPERVTDVPKEMYIPPEPSNDESEIFGAGISSGINFDKFDSIPVEVSGDGGPPALTDFESSGLDKYVLDNVRKSGYLRPTPIQKNAIPVILSGIDLMACAQTGSGKTAAFLLPIIHTLLTKPKDLAIGKPHVVIISPTRELSIQIYTEARKYAMGSYLKLCNIYGGTASNHQSNMVGGGCHILVATPGRLLDFVEKTFITFEDVCFVVLDEADRMLDMGFMPSVEKMMSNETMPATGSRTTLMFSATFPEQIQRLAAKYLQNYIFVTIGVVGGACSDVDQNFYEVSKFKKRHKLISILEECDPTGTIVFVATKRNADFLASILSESKFPTTSIHGDRLQREREEALRDFKTGKMKLLIATSVAARGLDIKNVAHVINYDMPNCVDEYVHRIGRTGRVGNKGKATSFYDPEQDSSIASDLVKILKQAGQTIPDFFDGSGGGSNDTGAGQNSKFGGKDVRDDATYRSSAQPVAEEEENW